MDNFLSRFLRCCRRLFGLGEAPPRPSSALSVPMEEDAGPQDGAGEACGPLGERKDLAPYDPDLLDRSRMQWQFGDWASLCALDVLTLEHHPDRPKLALLVASAWQQANDHVQARLFADLAMRWGCEKKFVARVFVSGLYNTLGRAACLRNDDAAMQAYFRQAVQGCKGDERLAQYVRLAAETKQIASSLASNARQGARLDAASPESIPVSPRTTAPRDGHVATRPQGGILSYAQNFEDVMLWRALGQVAKGVYVDVGAQDPRVDSVSRAFYEHGWRGVHVEPSPAYAEALRRDRPDERVIEAAVGDCTGELVFYESVGGGLSTGDPSIARQHRERGIPMREIVVACKTLDEILETTEAREIHWLKIDVEGLEADVLKSWRDAAVRPWIVLVESTLPLTQIETHHLWEHYLLQRNYVYVYFDGLNRFYVAKEHEDLAGYFLYGPNVFDDFQLSGLATAPFADHFKSMFQKADAADGDDV